MGFFKHGIGSLIAKALPVAAAFIPGVGPLASAALVAGAGAASSKLQGGSWGDALKAGALSGLGSIAAPMLGNAFASEFPETAGALGIAGGKATILDSLGLGSAPTAANAAVSGASGLTQGTQDFLRNLGGPEEISSQLAAADPSLAASGAGATAGAAPSGLSALTGKIPVVGPIMDKAATWAGDNPLTATGLALGGAQMIASIRQRQQQEKAQQEQQTQMASQNAQDSANWRLTLNSPPLPRAVNPNLSNMDWTRYGYGPEQEMLTNNQLFPGQYMAAGGIVKGDDGEPDMDPLPNLRNKVKNYPRRIWPSPQNNLNNANRRTNIAQPNTDGEPDMDPIKKLRGGIVRMAKGGTISGVPLPKSGIKLTASPRGSNAPSTTVPFTSLMPKISPLSMNSRVRKVGGVAKMPRSGKKYMAEGGETFPRKSGRISGPGAGQADKVRAMLSDGEFVVPADVVAHLGDGSSDAGADALHKLIHKVRKTKTGRTKMPPPIKTSDLMDKLATRGNT